MDSWPKGLLDAVTVASPRPVAAWSSAELNGFVVEEGRGGGGGGGGGGGASWCVVVGAEGTRPPLGLPVPVADGAVAPAVAEEGSKKEAVVVKVRQGLGVSRISLWVEGDGTGGEGRGRRGIEEGGGGEEEEGSKKEGEGEEEEGEGPKKEGGGGGGGGGGGAE